MYCSKIECDKIGGKEMKILKTSINKTGDILKQFEHFSSIGIELVKKMVVDSVITIKTLMMRQPDLITFQGIMDVNKMINQLYTMKPECPVCGSGIEFENGNVGFCHTCKEAYTFWRRTKYNFPGVD